MIEQGDLTRPCRIQVEDGYTRPWRRAFRRTPKYRTVFMGFIQQWSHDLQSGVYITIEDPFTRLQRSQVMM